MSLCHFLKKKVSIRGAISVGFGDWKVGFTSKHGRGKGKNNFFLWLALKHCSEELTRSNQRRRTLFLKVHFYGETSLDVLCIFKMVVSEI